MKLPDAQGLPFGRRSLPARVAKDACLMNLGFVIAAAILVFFGVRLWAEYDAQKKVMQLLIKIQNEVSVSENGKTDVHCESLNQSSLPIKPPPATPEVSGNWKRQIAYIQCGNEIKWIGYSSNIEDVDKMTPEKLTELASTATPIEERPSARDWPLRFLFPAWLENDNFVAEWVKDADSDSMWHGQHTFRVKPKSEKAGSEVQLTVGVISLGDRIRVNMWKLWKNTFLAVCGVIITVGGAFFYVTRRRIRSLTRLCSEIDQLRNRKREELSQASGDPDEIALIVNLLNEYLRVQRRLEDAQREQLENLEQLLDEVQNGEWASRHAIGRMLDGLVGASNARTSGRLRQLKDILSYQLDIGSIRFRCSQLQTATDPTRAEFVYGFKNMLKMKRNIEFEFVPRPSQNGLRVWVDKIDLKEMLTCLVDNAEAHSGQEATRVQVVMERGEDKVRLSVEDDGKGFPKDRHKRRQLTSWLCKGEGSNGSGVGLAYVFDAAAACGGKLQLGTSEALGGARATIELPLIKPSFGAE